MLVDEPYRNQKLGSQLLEKSFEYLNTDKPVITIPEANRKQFDYFIKKYGWKENEIIDDYYSPEIVFNKY